MKTNVEGVGAVRVSYAKVSQYDTSHGMQRFSVRVASNAPREFEILSDVTRTDNVQCALYTARSSLWFGQLAPRRSYRFTVEDGMLYSQFEYEPLGFTPSIGIPLDEGEVYLVFTSEKGKAAVTKLINLESLPTD